MKFLCRLFAVLFLVTGVVQAEEPFEPWAVWKEGMERYTAGERMLKRGDLARALEELKAARECYILVREKQVDWNQKIIAGRIELCDRAIAAATARAAGIGVGSSDESGNSSSGASIEKRPTQAKESPRVLKLEQDVQSLNQRLEDKIAELERTKLELERNQINVKTIENLLREKRLLEEKIQTLESRSVSPASPGQVSADNLQQQHELLIQERSAHEKTLQQLTDARNELRELREEISQLHGSMADLRQKARVAEDKVAASEYEITSGENQLLDLNRKVAELTTLQHQLETQSKQLNSQLEQSRKENANLTRQLQTLTQTENGAEKINGELLTENQNVKAVLQEKSAKLDQAESQILLLQDQLRATRLEQERLSNTLKTISDRNRQLLDDQKALNLRFDELSTADRKLIVELQEMTDERDAALRDAQENANALVKLQQELDQRESMQYQNVFALDDQVRSLQQSLDAEKIRAIDAETRLAEAEMLASEARNEFIQLKSDTLSWQRDAKRLPELEQQLAELASAKKALEAELIPLRDRSAQLSELEEKLKSAETTLATLSPLRDELTALQTANQQLANDLAEAKTKLETVNTSPVQRKELAADEAHKLLTNGMEEEAKGAYEVALWNYRQILDAKPDDINALRRMGSVFLKTGRFEEATLTLQRALSLQPDDLLLCLDLAQACNARKKFGNTLELLTPFLQTNPDHVQLNYQLGVALTGAGRLPEGEMHLQKALAVEPENAVILQDLALCLASGAEERKSEAADYYRRARDLGAAPMPEVEEKLQNLLQDQTETIAFLYQAAEEAELAEDFVTAAWFYQELILLDKSPKAVNKLAWAKLKCQEFEEVKTLLTGQARQADTAGTVLLALNELLQGNIVTGEQYFSEARQQNNNAPWEIPVYYQNLVAEVNIFFASQPASSPQLEAAEKAWSLLLK